MYNSEVFVVQVVFAQAGERGHDQTRVLRKVLTFVLAFMRPSTGLIDGRLDKCTSTWVCLREF